MDLTSNQYDKKILMEMDKLLKIYESNWKEKIMYGHINYVLLMKKAIDNCNTKNKLQISQ